MEKPFYISFACPLAFQQPAGCTPRGRSEGLPGAPRGPAPAPAAPQRPRGSPGQGRPGLAPRVPAGPGAT